jgi:AraC-like DNA-binding protein
MVDWGVTEEGIFEATGIREENLINYDDRVPVELYVKLGRLAPTLTNIPYIGLVLGRQAKFTNMGIVFQLGLNCPTIRESLIYGVRYSNLGNEAAIEGFEEGKEFAEWSSQYVGPNYMAIPLIEFESCDKLKLLKSVIGNDFKPVQFKFQHSQSQYLDKYHEIFQVPLLFKQEKNAIVFKREYLDASNPDPQPYVKELLDRHARLLDKELKTGRLFQDKVRNMIVRHLHTGSLDLEMIAKFLNISSRTVYRKLKEENLSYKELLDDVQKQLAGNYLIDDSLSINEISFLLGFSETGAFHRAFRRWFGKTPGQYRREHERPLVK